VETAVTTRGKPAAQRATATCEKREDNGALRCRSGLRSGWPRSRASSWASPLTVVTHNTAELGRVPGLLLEDWEV